MECPDCGSKDIIEDVENGKDIRVCSECGSILWESQVLSSDPSFKGTSTSDGFGYAPESAQRWSKNTKREPTGRTGGKKFIQRVGQIFKFRDFMIEGAVNLYQRTYDEAISKHKTEAKQAMCLCCLYVIARENDYAVTVRDFSYFFEEKGSVHKFSIMLRLLKDQFSTAVKTVSISNESEHFLSKANFPQSLINQTKKLIGMLNGTIGFDGKSKCLMIIAAAYIVWKASAASHKKTTLKDFCKQYNLVYTPVVYKRKKEIEEVVKRLIMKLPWVIAELNKNPDIDVYLTDVIQFQRSLIQRELAEAKKSLLTESESEEVNRAAGKSHLMRKCRNVSESADKEPDVKHLRLDTDAEHPRLNTDVEHSKFGKDGSSFSEDDDLDVREYIKSAKEVRECLKMHAAAESQLAD